MIIQQEAAYESQTLKDEIRELQQNLVELKTESQIKENDLTRKLQTVELEATKLQYQVENLNEQVHYVIDFDLIMILVNTNYLHFNN